MFRRIDLLLLGITVVLTLFGLAMIGSVSVFGSYQLTLKLTEQGLMSGPSNAFYLWRSFEHVIFGFGMLVLAMHIPYHFWERNARNFFFLTMALSIAVLIPGLGADWGTAAHWLRLGPLSLQPSEFLKLGMIFYLAVWLQKRQQLIGTFKEGFIPFIILLITCTFVIALEPDLGTFLIMGSIACTMFFIAGGNLFQLLGGGLLASILGLPIILQKAYIRARFIAFLKPNDPNIVETIGFQIKQALIAIGSGGPFGVGYGKSIQKFGYLPEVQADMIFSAMCEELGFFRLLIVLGMYGIFVYRGYRIAQNAPDRFGFMIAIGITTWIASQTVVNIAVNLGLFPLTGITLPFISYGGSSLASLLFAVGILLNVSSYSTETVVSVRREKRQPSATLRRSFF